MELRQGTGVERFDDFYRACRDRVAKALVFTLNDHDLGVEATDEAMARAFQSWPSVSTYRNPSGWVYRVALNWARNCIRRGRREIAVDHVADAVCPSVAHVADAQLDEKVRSLPLKLRAVIVLRYYLDWSTEQTAEALGLPQGTVKSRSNRALRQLSDVLENEQ